MSFNSTLDQLACEVPHRQAGRVLSALAGYRRVRIPIDPCHGNISSNFQAAFVNGMHAADSSHVIYTNNGSWRIGNGEQLFCGLETAFGGQVCMFDEARIRFGNSCFLKSFLVTFKTEVVDLTSQILLLSTRSISSLLDQILISMSRPCAEVEPLCR